MKNNAGSLFEKYLQIALLLIALTAVLLLYINKARIPFFVAIPAREAQTASQTRYFYDAGIDLLRPKYDLTPTPQYLLQEFPMYQAVLAIIYRIAGFNEVLGKDLSVIALIGSLVYIFLICNHFEMDRYVAVIATMIFAVAPFTLRFFPVLMIDPTTLLLSLVTLFHGLRWIEKNNIVDYWVFFIAGLIACLVKFMFLIPVCVPLFVMFFVSMKRPPRNEMRRITAFLMAFFCWAIALVLWVSWSSYLNSQTTLQAFNDTVIQYSYVDKWLGTLAMRIDPSYLGSLQWITGAFVPTWISIWLFYGLLIIGLFIGFLRTRKNLGIFMVSWTIGFASILLVFFPALSTHIYYWLPALPIAALLLAGEIDVVFGFLSDSAIHLKLDTKYSRLLVFSLVLILGGIGITLGTQRVMNGFDLWEYKSPNQFDYYTGLILFFFVGFLWLLCAYCLFFRQMPMKALLSILIIGSLSVTFYSNLFYPSERFWDIPPDRGYHWSTMRLLLREAEYIERNHDLGNPIVIVTKYNYYPHILYLSHSRGYTFRYPEDDVDSACFSAAGFPVFLSNPCISLVHEQGIEDVFVIFYDVDLDMKEADFKNIAPSLHLQFIDQMMSDTDQYGNVLHYRIDLP